VILLAITATPLSGIWFERISGLEPALASMAILGMWIALPMPALSVYQSWYQGVILHGRRTKGITEAVIVFLVTCSALLWAGVAWGRITGLYVGLAAFVTAMLLQTVWLWFASRSAESRVLERDQFQASQHPSEAPAD